MKKTKKEKIIFLVEKDADSLFDKSKRRMGEQAGPSKRSKQDESPANIVYLTEAKRNGASEYLFHTGVNVSKIKIAN